MKSAILENLEKRQTDDTPMGDYAIDDDLAKFKLLIEEEENLFNIAAQEILEKVDFLKVFKQYQGNKMHDVFSDDGKF